MKYENQFLNVRYSNNKFHKKKIQNTIDNKFYRLLYYFKLSKIILMQMLHVVTYIV